MAITANVDLGNGASASSCYIIVPNAHVKKFRPEQDGESANPPVGIVVLLMCYSFMHPILN